MGFSQAGAAIPGPVSGAAPTRLIQETWQPGQGPVYGGGFARGSLADMYRKAGEQNPYQANQDPYFSDWKGEGQGRQLSDRQQLQDLYAQLQKQAAGGMTPQQQQLLTQQGQAAQLQGNIANSAAGGAYAQSAARGAMLQNSGVQGAQNVQAQQQLRASDMMNATNQMQQVAQMQRAQDLQAQGMSMEDAFRQAEAEAKARGMNINRQLGYGGLELSAIQGDYASYLDALRRAAQKRQADIAQGQQDFGTAMQVGGSLAKGIGGFMGGG